MPAVKSKPTKKIKVTNKKRSFFKNPLLLVLILVLVGVGIFIKLRSQAAGGIDYSLVHCVNGLHGPNVDGTVCFETYAPKEIYTCAVTYNTIGYGTNSICVKNIRLFINNILIKQAYGHQPYIRGYVHCGGYSGYLEEYGAKLPLAAGLQNLTFGRAEQNAVIAVQAVAGLPRTGVVDRATWSVIGACVQ